MEGFQDVQSVRVRQRFRDLFYFFKFHGKLFIILHDAKLHFSADKEQGKGEGKRQTAIGKRQRAKSTGQRGKGRELSGLTFDFCLKGNCFTFWRGLFFFF
jgi:hypothetical protein